jgi:hypothetical protein
LNPQGSELSTGLNPVVCGPSATAQAGCDARKKDLLKQIDKRIIKDIVAPPGQGIEVLQAFVPHSWRPKEILFPTYPTELSTGSG